MNAGRTDDSAATEGIERRSRQTTKRPVEMGWMRREDTITRPLPNGSQRVTGTSSAQPAALR